MRIDGKCKGVFTLVGVSIRHGRRTKQGEGHDVARGRIAVFGFVQDGHAVAVFADYISQEHGEKSDSRDCFEPSE
jgi:hypothetical protein